MIGAPGPQWNPFLEEDVGKPNVYELPASLRWVTE